MWYLNKLIVISVWDLHEIEIKGEDTVSEKSPGWSRLTFLRYFYLLERSAVIACTTRIFALYTRDKTARRGSGGYESLKIGLLRIRSETKIRRTRFYLSDGYRFFYICPWKIYNLKKKEKKASSWCVINTRKSNWILFKYRLNVEKLLKKKKKNLER